MKTTIDPASFRDPSGFVFTHNHKIYRQINPEYKPHYRSLIDSGLYDDLVRSGLLIKHRQVDLPLKSAAYLYIEPQFIPFVSYPYEWCFSQLRDAALCSLKIQKKALEKNMSLKDASSYNIQFLEGKPLLIDTLSFEIYREGEPWVAYRQFCEQFLAPLALAAYTDHRLIRLTAQYMGGIPLDLTSKLLPVRAKLVPGLIFHILLHGRSQEKVTRVSDHQIRQNPLNRNSLLGLLDSLESTVSKLKLAQKHSLWSEYARSDASPSYSPTALSDKINTVTGILTTVKSKYVWDIGANTGTYSKIAAAGGSFTVAMDFDPLVVDFTYNSLKREKTGNILPLQIDLTNPTPACGWENLERKSLLGRPLPDTVLALAVIHHLAISNNIPLKMLADFFARICRNLIIEFIPKTDKQVVSMLVARKDIFSTYTPENFENEFEVHFKINSKHNILDSQRILYHMTRKPSI